MAACAAEAEQFQQQHPPAAAAEHGAAARDAAYKRSSSGRRNCARWSFIIYPKEIPQQLLRAPLLLPTRRPLLLRLRSCWRTSPPPLLQL